jgi:L-tyrosine isonitrile synthase
MSQARDILDIFFRFRRLTLPAADCAELPCAECYAPHMGKVAALVRAGQPVHFIMPAFPGKSPNPAKVLGALPDLAELLALEFLQSCCTAVGRRYPPGARITICSDGHVFGGAVGLADETICGYRRELVAMIGRGGFGSLGLFSLQDVFGGKPFHEMRACLLRAHAEPLPSLRDRLRRDTGLRRQFNGVHRFLLEDQAGLHPPTSRTRFSQDCKALAYEVIQRSDAWGRMLAEVFPDAVRLSIHPQAAHSTKIGVHLACTKDNWLTPWHGVAVELGDGVLLAKRYQAERSNATLVRQGSRPSHFTAPHLSLAEVSAWQPWTSTTAA